MKVYYFANKTHYMAIYACFRGILEFMQINFCFHSLESKGDKSVHFKKKKFVVPEFSQDMQCFYIKIECEFDMKEKTPVR